MPRLSRSVPPVIFLSVLAAAASQVRAGSVRQGVELHRFQPSKVGQRYVYKVRQRGNGRTYRYRQESLIQRIDEGARGTVRVTAEIRSFSSRKDLDRPSTLSHLVSREGLINGVENDILTLLDWSGVALPHELSAGQKWKSSYHAEVHLPNPIRPLRTAVEVEHEVVRAWTRTILGKPRRSFRIRSLIVSPTDGEGSQTPWMSEVAEGIGTTREWNGDRSYLRTLVLSRSDLL